jgi:hypothetical protein
MLVLVQRVNNSKEGVKVLFFAPPRRHTAILGEVIVVAWCLKRDRKEIRVWGRLGNGGGVGVCAGHLRRSDAEPPKSACRTNTSRVLPRGQSVP